MFVHFDYFLFLLRDVDSGCLDVVELSNFEYECCVYVACMNDTLPDNNLWLQASPVMIGERQCYVEEKRTTGSRGKSIYIFVLSKAWRLLVECKFVYFEKYYVFVYVFFWIAIIMGNKITAVAGGILGCSWRFWEC